MFKALWRQGPFALMATGVIIAIVVLSVGVSFVLAPPAHAFVPERPTVELVKMFGCSSGRYTADECAAYIEGQANAWLQSVQPGMRITQRILSTERSDVFLVIFYEVPEWRTKQPKPPAEKP